VADIALTRAQQVSVDRTFSSVARDELRRVVEVRVVPSSLREDHFAPTMGSPDGTPQTPVRDRSPGTASYCDGRPLAHFDTLEPAGQIEVERDPLVILCTRGFDSYTFYLDAEGRRRLREPLHGEQAPSPPARVTLTLDVARPFDEAFEAVHGHYRGDDNYGSDDNYPRSDDNYGANRGAGRGRSWGDVFVVDGEM